MAEPISNSSSSTNEDKSMTIGDSKLACALGKTKQFLSDKNLDNHTRSTVDDLIVVSYKKNDFPMNISSMRGKTIQTRAQTEEIDTLSVYLIEYEKNGVKGFSIASDDYRIPLVLALSENGSLADTLYNQGLAIYIEGLGALCQQQLEEYYDAEQENESIDTRGLIVYKPSKPNIDSYLMTRTIGDDWLGVSIAYTSDGTVVRDINPLLRTKWNQWSPYNNKVKTGCPAGCVAVATAQIMAYFKKPYTEDYWNELTTLSYVPTGNPVLSDRVATLMATVGAGVGTKYDSDGSGADFTDASPYLRSVGISNTCHSSLTTERVIHSLINAMPVMGNEKRTKIIPGFYKNGHVWIIDGLYQFDYTSTVSYYEVYDEFLVPSRVTESDWEYVVECGFKWKKTQRQTATYYHINWGWGGYSDGYYTALNYSYENNQNYKYDNKMITFI